MCERKNGQIAFGLVLIAVLAWTNVSPAPAHVAASGDRTRGSMVDLIHPLDNDIFRAGEVIDIIGTVAGPDFQHFTVEWGYGQNPSSWFTTGVVLTGGGSLPVIDDTLATWDTSSIVVAEFTTVRITGVFTSGNIVETLLVYLDPTLAAGWPVKIAGDLGFGPFGAVVADLDHDQNKEIIVYAAGDPAMLYVFDHLGNARPGFPVAVEPNSGSDVHVPFPAVGDMDNDGDDEIVVFRPKNSNGNCANPPSVLIYESDGSLLSTLPVSYPGFTWPNWCRDFASGKQSMALADLDNDGSLEIILGSEGAATVLDSQGATLPGWPIHLYGWIGGGHEGSPAVGNLDADDDLEIIFAVDWAEIPNEPGEDRGRVYALNMDGTDVSGWPVTTRGFSFGSPTIGDVDNDAQEDVLVGLMYTQVPDPSDQFGVHVYDRGGVMLPGFPALPDAWLWSNPILGDWGGDSMLEIVASTSTPTGQTYMIDSGGSTVAGWPQTMCWTDWYSPIIGDVTGDGVADVITTTNYIDGDCSVYAREYSGALIDGFPKVTGASVEAPAALADIDNDGLVELIATSNVRELVGGAWIDQGCIYVWETGVAYDPCSMHWPMFRHDLQHTGRYSIPDTCGCPTDLNGDGYVGTGDLLELFSQWGTDGPADFDGSGAVGTGDLLILFANWGPCP